MSTSEIAYGLGGLLAGAILTGAVDVAIGWHQRRLAKRAASRAIFSDLYWARTCIEEALEKETWDEIPPSVSADWVRYRDALSNGMRGTEFHRISGAYHELQVLNHIKARGEDFGEARCKGAADRFREAEKVIARESLTWRDRRWMKAEDHQLTDADSL